MGKASKRCWFSKLTDAQLVALAQAVGIAAAPGATHTLVARLHANALAAPYGKTYLSPIGTTSDDGGWYFELATDRELLATRLEEELSGKSTPGGFQVRVGPFLADDLRRVLDG